VFVTQAGLLTFFACPAKGVGTSKKVREKSHVYN